MCYGCIPCISASMPSSRSDLASTVSIVPRDSSSATASTSALTWRSWVISASYTASPARWAVGQARAGLPPVGLVLEQRQVVGLVVVYPDDAGHGSVVQHIGPGPGGLEHLQLLAGYLDALTDMAGEPAELTDRVPVLLTPGLSAHRPSVATGGPAKRRISGRWSSWAPCLGGRKGTAAAGTTGRHAGRGAESATWGGRPAKISPDV